MANFKELTMLYLKKDVLSLTDNFQTFSNKQKESYGVNPLHSYSTPSLTWKAGLKYTGVKLDYITAEEL